MTSDLQISFISVFRNGQAPRQLQLTHILRRRHVTEGRAVEARCNFVAVRRPIEQGMALGQIEEERDQTAIEVVVVDTGGKRQQDAMSFVLGGVGLSRTPIEAHNFQQAMGDGRHAELQQAYGSQSRFANIGIARELQLGAQGDQLRIKYLGLSHKLPQPDLVLLQPDGTKRDSLRLQRDTEP